MEEKGADIGPGLAIQENHQTNDAASCQTEAYRLGGSVLPFGDGNQRRVGSDGSGFETDTEASMGAEGLLPSEIIRAECAGAKGRITPTDILALLARQDYRCAYTDEPLTPDNVGADHINPASKNGVHGIGNIALVLGTVNRAKGTMSLDEFVSMCRLVSKKFSGQGSIRVAG